MRELLLLAQISCGLPFLDWPIGSQLLSVASAYRSTDHFYPALNWLLEKDMHFMQWYTKNFFVGEFDWTNAVSVHEPGCVSNSR